MANHITNERLKNDLEREVLLVIQKKLAERLNDKPSEWPGKKAY